MTDLIKRLNEELLSPYYDYECGILPSGQWSRVCDERKEAAEALERLGLLANEHVSTIEKWQTAAEKAERELAEARAREERKDAALVKIAQETAATWVSDTAREALAAPAPEECPHGCRGTGWIGAVNDWGDTAALPCPVHHQNDTSNK